MVTFNPINSVFEVSSFSPKTIAGFTTAQSPEIEHIENVRKIVSMNQTHSTNIALITDHMLENSRKVLVIRDVDGLITSQKNVMLVVKTADCVPMFYEDYNSHLIAASHQGWKGTYLNMSAHMIQRLIGLGAEAESIRVAIGPAIGPCCYKVTGPRKEIMYQLYPEYADAILEDYNNGIGINFVKLNYLQLLSEGILPENITYVLSCTRCNRLFHSFQRDATKDRQLSFIMKHD